MKPSLSQIAASAMVVLGVLFLAVSGSPAGQTPPGIAAAEHDREFKRSIAGISAQLQTRGRLRQDMQRYAADPVKTEEIRHRWDQAGRRIDALVAQARSAAHSEEQRSQLEHLAALASHATPPPGHARR